MSITFSLGNSVHVTVTNSYFDYDMPPDVVYNPPEMRMEVTPYLNVTNRNGLALLKMLGLPEEYTGTIDPNRIPEFSMSVSHLYRKFLRMRAKGEVTPEEGTDILNDIDRNIRYFETLEKMAKYAELSKVAIFWG